MSGKYFVLENEEKKQKKACPEESANILSRISFWWAQSLVSEGYKHPLTEDDLFELPDRLDSQKLANALDVNWDRKWPLAQAIIRFFARNCLYSLIFPLIVATFSCINPFLIRTLVVVVQSGSISISGHPVFTNGWQVVVTLFIATTFSSTVRHMGYWHLLRAAQTIRGAVLGIIYRKSTKMSNSCKGQGFNAGSVTNIVAVDADSVMIFIWDGVDGSVIVPLQTIALLTIVITILGPVGLLGFGLMVAATPLNGLLAKRTTAFADTAREFSDSRIKLVTEILQGIRLLKVYNWEEPFRERVQTFRHDQEKSLDKAQRMNMWVVFMSSITSCIILGLTFAAYAFFGNPLTLDVAFISLALFQNLADPLRRLPLVINDFAKFIVAVKRIEEYLKVDEVDAKYVQHNSSSSEVVIVDGGFYWAPQKQEVELVKGDTTLSTDEIPMNTLNSSAIMVDVIEDADGESVPPALQNINFKAAAGKLTCVVGPVGCGKSALLQAILGELTLVSGSVFAPSDISYTPQIPWLITATLQENILFGSPMDTKRYNDVLVACALTKDLELLPNGDQTEIGEQGINLSGGQKQRVSLARSLYANSPCFILDEPLSAVDSHVAAWLFEHCIKGMMDGRTRVLVTHQLQFLPRADSIYVLSHGNITHSGTYDELQQQGVDFETLVRKKFAEGESEEIEEAPQPAESNPPPSSHVPENEGEGEKAKEIDENSEEMPMSPQAVQKTVKAGLISVEERQVGAVEWSVYYKYFSASGKFWMLIVTLLFYLIANGIYVSSSYWIVIWAGDTWNLTTKMYVGIYFGIILAFACVRRLGLHGLQVITHKSANNLHFRLFNSVIDAKASFFDMTPTGRIMNRFSKDQGILDSHLLTVAQEMLECSVSVFCSIALICILTPLFLIPLVGLGVLYFFIQRYYRATCRELKRLLSISFSPILSCTSETMNGLVVIRAFKREKHFTSVFYSKIEANQRLLYNEFSVNRWLGMRLEWIAALVVLFACSFAMLTMETLGPGLVGLVVTMTLSLSGVLNWAVRQYTQLEVEMNAVERILHYCNTIPQEETRNQLNVANSWPESGSVDIKDLVIKYREDLDPVLRGVNCNIKAGEKIGVVGRTGAGKSTLTTALFRMVEATSGTISIDGVDISKVGLGVLRSRLSIIPQDPVLFTGTVRMNLDPFEKHSDAELWKVLDQVHLSKHVSQIPKQLDFHVDSGEGFSVGQRQLLCLGRAILRKTKILVMDEATASLDFNTDALIKTTVRECFVSETLITIAHRLDTILDSDRVMVFDQGKIAEFDSPTALLQNPSSKFAGLVSAARASIKNP